MCNGLVELYFGRMKKNKTPFPVGPERVGVLLEWFRW